MYKKIKKIFSTFLIMVLIGSNFFNIFFVNAEEVQGYKPPKPEKNITFCHVPDGNIGNPQTLTIPISAYENGHSNHELDYLGECIDSDISISKTIGDVIDNGEGSFTVDYSITVSNNGGTGLYSLGDRIEASEGVSIDINPIVFNDDDSNGLPQVNPSFNGLDQTSIITNESILYGPSSDSFEYSVDYLVSPDAVPSDQHCEGSDNQYENYVIVENFAGISDIDNQNDETCIELPIPQKQVKTANVHVNKIVCDDESYLPNWGNGDDDIDENTVSEFLAEGTNSSHCELINDRKFQWANSSVSNPGDNYYGEAGEGWTTFLGQTELIINDLNQIRVREVLEDGYIPFSYGLNSNTNVNDVSAEIYCHKDVINYDNYDYIDFEEGINDYYCLAFNYTQQEIPEAFPVCEDGKKYMKITLDKEAGGINTNDNKIWFGNKIAPVGVWFEIPNDAEISSHTQGAVMTYYGDKLYVDLLKNSSETRMDFAGTIELHGTEVTGDLILGKPGNNTYKLENLANCGPACHLDIFEKQGTQKINFDFATSNAHDEGSMMLSNKVESCIQPMKIVATKVICDNEEDLPNNFGGTLEVINSSTAQDWVDNHQGCRLVEGWSFQYSLNNDATAPIGSYYGEAGEGWTTFGPTNSGGVTEVLNSNLDGISKIKIREVLKDSYIPFSDGKAPTPEYSAEIYCGTDIGNYDNEERISGGELSYGNTVYCVAWNAPIPDITGGVAGYKFKDSNYNGQWDKCIDYSSSQQATWDGVCENGVEGWNVTLTLNQEGGEEYTKTTGIDGYYLFEDIPVGEYILCEEQKEGWVQTFPKTQDGCYLVEITDGSYQEYNFGNFEGKQPLNKCENDFSVNNLKDLSIIDLTTGIQNHINDLEFPTYAAASDPVTGNIYYIQGVNTNPKLAVYNIFSHTNTIIGNTGVYRLFTKLAFDINGNLYGMTEYPSSNFYKINLLTGLATEIDTTPLINQDGGDLTFDDSGDMYVAVKQGKFYKVDLISNTTTANYLGDLKYDGKALNVTGLVFKNGKFYVTDASNNLYSFTLSTINSVSLISDQTNLINDLSSCPVNIIPKTGTISGYKFKDNNYNGEWDKCLDISGDLPAIMRENCETGIKGWGITLTSNLDPSITYSINTNDEGQYVFENIAIGEYILCEEQREGWIQTSPKTDNGCYLVEVIAGRDAEYDFGNFEGREPLNKCGNDFSVNNDKDLSIINLNTGIQSHVNDLEFGSSASAVDPETGNIYYIERVTGNPRVAMYNIFSHTNTVLGYTNVNDKSFTKMAFGQNGKLYAMTEFKNSHLYTIDIIDGHATHIDATPLINKSGGDLTFDDNGEMYVLVKDGKFYKVDFTSTNTTATFIGYVLYDKKEIQATGLVFKGGKFYATDDSNKLYSFELSDLDNALLISSNTNNINDLASCPVAINTSDDDGDSDDEDDDGDENGDGEDNYPVSRSGGNGTKYDSSCGTLTIDTQITENSDGTVDLTCTGDLNSKAFMLDCGDGTPVQIKNSFGGVLPYATFTCNYSTSQNYKATCRVTEEETQDSESTLWSKNDSSCNADIVFNLLTSYEVKDEIVAAGEEFIMSESDGNGTDEITNLYNNYLELLEIQKNTNNANKKKINNYIYGYNISTKNKMSISKIIGNLENYDKDKKREIIVDIFSKVNDLIIKFEGNQTIIELLNYLKLQLAISYFNI